MTKEEFHSWAVSACPGGEEHETTEDCTFWKTDCYECQWEMRRSAEEEARREALEEAAREVASTTFHLTVGATLTIPEMIGVFDKVRDELADRLRALAKNGGGHGSAS
jgi:hypothetical protein